MLVKCDHDESYREKIAPIFPKGPTFVAQTKMKNLRCTEFSQRLLLTGKFRRGVTERVRLKRMMMILLDVALGKKKMFHKEMIKKFINMKIHPFS